MQARRVKAGIADLLTSLQGMPVSYSMYVNLPVENLAATKAFFTALGFSFDPAFTNDDAAGMIIREGHCYVMLLTKPMFHGFFPHKAISDANTTVEVSVALQCDSRAAVDGLVAKALAAGGRTYAEPKDYGFMYGHGFEDLDGHIWELFHMNAMPPQG